MVNSKVGRRETTTDDVDAYDLIMKNKELLLDRDPKRSPVRFIFSHSALREGWDNPNVFQICTLKQSGSDVRKRQEVGRGLRLCVNQDGERQDANVLGNDVHNINILTVIASESYDSFAKGLQSEIAEAVADRPRAITVDLFVGKVIKDSSGHEQVIDKDIADAIMYDLIINRYIDKKGALTDKYYEEKANGTLQVAEEVADCAASVVEIIGSIYDPKTMQPENARSNNVELHVDEEKIAMPEFKALWSKINAKSVYIVDFDTDELVQKAIASLDAKLRVAKIFFKVESGVMEEIKSKEALESGAAFIKETSASYGTQTRISVNSSVKYDLVGKLVEETKLTRKDIIAILRGIQKPVFEQFKDNPEEFIIKAAALINDEKATAIIQHISLMYQRNNKNYEMLINICYFVLDGMLQTTDKGNYKMMTFSDEHMHRLYEKFVLEYFKRHHSYLSEVRAAQVKWNLATDTEESMIRFLPAMQTDIFLRYKEKVLIIDTKYYGNSMQKQYDKVTIHSGNMYQIFTYVKNQDVENNGRVSGMLLYAKTEEAITPDCSFVIGGNKISVKTVDLNKEFKLIAAQLDKIAEDYFGKKRIEDSII